MGIGAVVGAVVLIGVGVVLGARLGDGGASAPSAGERTAHVSDEGSSGVTDQGGADRSDAPDQAASGPLEVVEVRELSRPERPGYLLSASPGGSYLLVADDDFASVCLRAIDRLEPLVCSDALAAPDGRFVGWSSGDRHAVIGDDVLTLFRGGDLLIFDAEQEIAELVGDTVPIQRDHGDAPFRIMYQPAVSPDGSRVAAMYRTDELTPGPGNIAIYDRTTGNTEVLDPVSGLAQRILWEPGGDAVWVSSLRSPADAGSPQLTRIDLIDGTRRTVSNEVLLGDLQDAGGPPVGELVQVDDSASVGLLLLTSLLGGRGQEEGVPYLAVVDLDADRVAPVLPHLPNDPELAGYTELWAARLSSDGSEVFATYRAGRTSFAEPDPDVPLRLVRISTASILAGSPEVEVVVANIGDLTDIEVPYVVPGNRSYVSSPLPGTDRRIALPINRLAAEQVVAPGRGPELFLEVELAP